MARPRDILYFASFVPDGPVLPLIGNSKPAGGFRIVRRALEESNDSDER